MDDLTAKLPQADLPSFDDALLERFPALGSLAMRSSYPAQMWGKAIPGTDLFAFYKDGRLDFVSDVKGGREYRPKSDVQREEERRFAAMTPGEVAHYFADRATFSSVSKVYFIGHLDHAIKIGVTVDIKGRFAAIQSHSPLPLQLLATRPGGQDRESAYHRQFEDHRLHNEWFSPHPDILAEIERLSA